MASWRFDGPCHVELTWAMELVEGDLDDLRAGTEAALLQLAEILPAGSRVTGDCLLPWDPRYAALGAGIAAAQSQMPEITIVAPMPIQIGDDDAENGDDEENNDYDLVTGLCGLGIWHVVLSVLRLTQLLANMVWPLRSLHVQEPTSLSQLLRFPRVTVAEGQQYQLSFPYILTARPADEGADQEVRGTVHTSP